MYGRSCSRLLALAFLILSPLFLLSQTERANPASQVARDLPSDFALMSPHWILPAAVEPTISVPRFPIASPGTIGFPLIARAAGMIFSGTVTAIKLHPANRGQSVETVAITFHIENALRGATPGSRLTILQWIGLWSSGQRYRVGERVLLFLYPRSKLGLTSCVAGPMGRFIIDRSGRILLSAQQFSAFRANSVLGGKSRARFSDFALAVRRASEEE